jgi:hypothetical protein
MFKVTDGNVEVVETNFRQGQRFMSDAIQVPGVDFMNLKGYFFLKRFHVYSSTHKIVDLCTDYGKKSSTEYSSTRNIRRLQKFVNPLHVNFVRALLKAQTGCIYFG